MTSQMATDWVPERNWPAPVRLARQIALDIIDQNIPVGIRLGLLPEVAQRYGISVPTLRKAITLLQEDGIVVSREGRSGGLEVAALPAAAAVQAMHVFFSDLGVTLEQVREARDLIDVALAERACRFADAAMLTQLEHIFRTLRCEGADQLDAIRQFDRAILNAARQPVFALISAVLGNLEAQVGENAPFDLPREVELRSACSAAILGGDLGGAITYRRLLRPFPEEFEGQRRAARLGDRVAASIKALIKERGLKPGDELGREVELQRLFGLGRITLRDALRPLERSGAIRVIPGRKGGIFVGAAEPYAAIEMISLYLSSIKLSFKAQIDSRKVLEPRAAWLAATRRTAATAGQLEAAAHDDRIAASASSPEWPQKGAQVERLIARACGNPLIEFFTLALVEMSLIQARSQEEALSADHPGLMRLVSNHHGEIVRHIVDGHPALAAFATRQYLTDLHDWVHDAELRHAQRMGR